MKTNTKNVMTKMTAAVTLTTMLLTGTAMTTLVPTAVFAGEGEVIASNGITFEIPAEYKDLLTIQTEGLEKGTLVTVSETASIEAAKAMGQDPEEVGAGWLFSIARIPENEMNQLRCGAMDGMEVFAEDDDMYYAMLHPTDVRVYREENTYSDEVMAVWEALNTWARKDVCSSILANDKELEPVSFGNTFLDIMLCRAAYMKDVKYEIRSLDFGTLDPSLSDDRDQIEELAEDVTYEEVADLNEAEGEYIVLYFTDEDVRLDFFLGEGLENYVRLVQILDGKEEIQTLYKATPEDADETTTGIMKEWAAELMGKDD